MIKIKANTIASPQGHWFYGPEYMVNISQKTARALCGMYPMPKMGHAIIVAIAKPYRLEVQNISGQYVLASDNAKIDQWFTVFGVEVQT